jgi:hypothetical protein
VVMTLRSPLVQAAMSRRTARTPVLASATRENVALLAPNPVPVQHVGRAPVPSSSDTFGSATGASAAAGTTGRAAPPDRLGRRPHIDAAAASQSTSAAKVAGVIVFGPQPSAGSQTWWNTSCTQPPPGWAAVTIPCIRSSVVVAVVV